MVRTMATLTPMTIMTMFTHAEAVLEMVMTTTMLISDDGYVMIV